jgi:hypothetical protein
MLAFIVTLRSGHRYTIRASELRTQSDCYELLAAPEPHDADPQPARQVVAVFDRGDVLSVVAREHLIASEEPGEGASPHAVAKADPIPF